MSEAGSVPSEWTSRIARIDRLLADVERRLTTAEARLDGLEEDHARHVDHNASDLDVLTRTVDRVGEALRRHEDAHWRSGR